MSINNNNLYDYETMTNCPYNRNHTFLKFKLIDHINRCKDALKSTEKLYFCKGPSIKCILGNQKYEEHKKICEACNGNMSSDQSKTKAASNSNTSMTESNNQRQVVNYDDEIIEKLRKRKEAENIKDLETKNMFEKSKIFSSNTSKVDDSNILSKIDNTLNGMFK